MGQEKTAQVESNEPKASKALLRDFRLHIQNGGEYRKKSSLP